MYFDEDMILDIRLNILNKFVSKFIICEAKFNHKGLPKKLNFDIKKFKKFEDKIDYVVVNDQPNNLFVINANDQEKIKKNKILDNALIRENFQRNFCYETLKNYHNEDLVIINDLDEIPNLENFRYKSKISIFKQKMYYYKFNLELPDFEWMGSKICKIKHLISPQWLRNVKPKKYPFWRIDTVFDKKKYNSINFINSGGWHFTNIMSADKIDFKMRNFLHHLEYEESGYDINKLNDLIRNKKLMYDHSADKKNASKWKEGKSLRKTDLNQLPNYIRNNQNKFEKWLD